MKIVGLMPVRNEEWILGFSARAALMWVDHLVILLHACTDRSHAIAQEIARADPARVWLLVSEEATWNEMEHRQALLEIAAEAADGPRATHIALIDADEVLTGNNLNRIGSLIHQMPLDGILQIPFFNLRGPAGLYHTNGIWAPRMSSIAFPYRPGLCWKGDRFHHREPMGLLSTPWRPMSGPGAGGVLHFWAADERRHRAKHALYKITERVRFPNKAWPEIEKYYNYGMRSIAEPWTFATIPGEWLEPYRELLPLIDYEIEPWQEAECRRLVELHGRKVFEGLDLFGVV